jgi:hypothetical protein
MSTTKPPTSSAVYPDRSTRLILLGAFQVLLGCMAGLGGLLSTAMAVVGPLPGAQSIDVRMMIPSIVFYFLFAAVLICLGLGLAFARRWAWTLTVVLSWMWLVVGVIATLALLFMVGPMMTETVAQRAPLPPEALMIMRVMIFAMSAFMYLVLPGIFIVFCHHESVRATCVRRDPKIPWTDRCPMPVLPVSILLAVGILSTFSSLAYGGAVPVFGVYLYGPAGVSVVVLMAALLAYLAWGTYRLQMAAWWGTVLIWIAGASSMAITFARGGLMEMYERMRMPPDQLEMIRKSGLVESMAQWGPWAVGLGGIAWLGYLLFVRRYFVHKPPLPLSHLAGNDEV